MALKLPIENAQGYSPEYHRIASVEFGDGIAIVEIASHKDADARKAGKAPAERRTARVKASMDATRADLYDQLKQMPVFKGASDI